LASFNRRNTASDGGGFSQYRHTARRQNRRLVITFINISEHKRLEEKLLENEKKFHLLLGASSDLKVILSNDMKVLECNSEADLFFGKKREDYVNKNFIQMFVPEGSQKSTDKNLNMLLNKGLMTI
jgi:PAS domain-containing protein